MIKILPISPTVESLIKKHSLQKKFTKQLALLTQNPRHPSLHLEILEPKWRGIGSFRIDRKYRALCIYRQGNTAMEIISITVHYR